MHNILSIYNTIFNGAKRGLPYPTEGLQVIVYNSTYEDSGTTYYRTSLGIGLPVISGTGLDTIIDFSPLNDVRLDKSNTTYWGATLSDYFYYNELRPYDAKLKDFHYRIFENQMASDNNYCFAQLTYVEYELLSVNQIFIYSSEKTGSDRSNLLKFIKFSSTKDLYTGELVEEYKTVYDLFDTKPSNEVALIFNDYLVNPLVQNDKWSKFDVLQIFSAQNDSDALINMINPSGDKAELSTAHPGFEKYGGFIGKSNSYINSKFIPINGTKFTQDDASMGTWIDFGSVGLSRIFGVGTSDDSVFHFVYLYPAEVSGDDIIMKSRFNSTGEKSGVVSEGNGLNVIVREAGGVLRAYKNGTQIYDLSQVSNGLSTDVVALLGYNSLGTFSSNYPDEMRMFFAGSSLTQADINIIYPIFNTFFNKIDNYRAFDYIRLADMPDVKAQHGMDLIDGKLYAVGNLLIGEDPNALYEYNIGTDVWTIKTRCPFTEGSHQSPVVRAVNGKLYFIGGLDSPSDVNNDTWEYDPILDTWTQKADMPTAREDMGSAVYDGKIFVFGGCTMATMEVYDPILDTWDETKADLPVTKMLGDFGCEVNGKIYAIGGQTDLIDYDDLHPDQSVYQYDPILDTWTQKADMPVATCYKECVPVGNYIYVFGGAGSGDAGNPSNMTDLIQIYDTINDTWRISEITCPVPIMGAALTLYNNEIYMSGGEAWNGGVAAFKWLWKFKLDNL